MSEAPALFLRILVIGVGATLTMDIVGVVLHRVAGTGLPDYAPVGRWIGHMARGEFRHASIAKAAPIAGEGPFGWAIHYLTGIVYAGLLLAIFGAGWAFAPTILPALAVGLGTLPIPFLVMQPAFGLGIAASKHPHPGAARLRSVVNHLAFGLGLYVSAWAVSPLFAR